MLPSLADIIAGWVKIVAVRFLIADDHPICRTAAELIVRAAYPDAEITAAGNLDETLAAGASADVILLDLFLPDSTGVATFSAVKAAFPLAKIVVITGAVGTDQIEQLRAEGVFGPIAKSAPMAILARAIDQAVAEAGQQGGRGIAVFEPIDERVASLTKGERKILEAMSSGQQNKQVAYMLGLSEATVKQHIKAILRKLGASNRTQAILIALSSEPEHLTPIEDM